MGKQGLGRRKPFKYPKPRILILTEGKRTEVIYLQGVCRAQHLTNISIEGAAGVPKTMVENAVSRKSAYDKIWCVFDVDIHPNLKEAVKQAKDNDVCVALSNPCFEVFLILHFELYTKPCDRHGAQRHLKSHIPDYDKTFDFYAVWPLFDTATENNDRLMAWHKTRGTSGVAPSTSVFDLMKFLVPPKSKKGRPTQRSTGGSITRSGSHLKSGVKSSKRRNV